MSILLLGTLATALLVFPAIHFACHAQSRERRRVWCGALILLGVVHGALHFGLSIEMNTPSPMWHLLVSAIRS